MKQVEEKIIIAFYIKIKEEEENPKKTISFLFSSSFFVI
jgi:hypothetical protein